MTEEMMIPALSCGLVGFDTETTGPNPHEDELVTAAIVMMNSQGKVRKRLTWMVQGQKEIAPGATAVHGITNEQRAEEGIDHRAGLETIANILRAVWLLKLPVVVYNAPFDITLMDNNLQRAGLPCIFHDVMEPLIIDPLVIDKALDKFRKGSRKHIDTAAFHDIHLGADDAHDACFDAIAACHVALRLYRKYSDLQKMNVPTLMAQQKKWYFEQMASLEEFKRKKDSTIVLGKEWPLQGLMGRNAPRGN